VFAEMPLFGHSKREDQAADGDNAPALGRGDVAEVVKRRLRD
jgi:hypothetical protein